MQSLEGPQGAVEWCCWHPKGGALLAGSEDMSMWMWLAQTGACMQVRDPLHGDLRPCIVTLGEAAS